VRRTFLADQIRRSASSVPLNYLEGCGRSGLADRSRFFGIAISSALGVVASNGRDAGHDICDHLIAMLRRFR
jgi:23S rRNA-intervening sequence protein